MKGRKRVGFETIGGRETEKKLYGVYSIFSSSCIFFSVV